MSLKNEDHGILLIDKPLNKTSFHLVYLLRKLTGIQKIGHAGTLDPLATGVMVMLVGKSYTSKSDLFLNDDKEYEVTIQLGSSTTTYDREGEITASSPLVPTLAEIELALQNFQGECEQTPPMFSAKKLDGKRLYELARKGIEVERKAQKVTLHTHLVRYNYPDLTLFVRCSKGTYIRSIAYDLGTHLGCHGHVKELVRVRSGRFQLEQCISVDTLMTPNFSYKEHLQRLS
ncbi:MAG: tRNA pseudouridine(55) synthase TruB [Chlamydiia bacterium]